MDTRNIDKSIKQIDHEINKLIKLKASLEKKRDNAANGKRCKNTRTRPKARNRHLDWLDKVLKSGIVAGKNEYALAIYFATEYEFTFGKSSRDVDLYCAISEYNYLGKERIGKLLLGSLKESDLYLLNDKHKTCYNKRLKAINSGEVSPRSLQESSSNINRYLANLEKAKFISVRKGHAKKGGNHTIRYCRLTIPK